VRVLLLSDIPPSSELTAGIVLAQLASFLPPRVLASYIVLDRTLDPELASVCDTIPIRMDVKPREHWRILPGKIGGAVSLGMETYTAGVTIQRMVDRICRFARENEVGAVWCVLQGQTMIRLALPTATRLRVPLLTQVWDPPGWWLRANHVDQVSGRRIQRTFANALAASSCCATVSEPMSEEYAAKYGVKCVALLPSMNASYALPPSGLLTPSSHLVIGMAGQLYASDAWLGLLRALDTVKWRLVGRNVRIVVLGRGFTVSRKAPCSIEYLGWYPQRETVATLAACDLLYCPYWFDPAYDEEVRLSFPSKLTTYLATGRPMLFHGPEHSAAAQFLLRHQAGFSCHTNDPAEILEAITSIVTDTEGYQRVTAAGRQAFDAHLTLDHLRTAFQDFLSEAGIDPAGAAEASWCTRDKGDTQ
jgi:glycosyltransferase involved in cell wall biosynthesis